MNDRRIWLIQKKNRAELTEAERIEFEHLQKIVYEAVDRAFPLPPINPQVAINLDRNSRADEGNANE